MSEVKPKSWSYTNTMLVNCVGRRQRSVQVKIVVWRCTFRTFDRGKPENGYSQLVNGYTGDVYFNGKKYEPLSEHRTEYSLLEEAGKIVRGYAEAVYREDYIEYELARQSANKALENP